MWIPEFVKQRHSAQMKVRRALSAEQYSAAEGCRAQRWPNQSRKYGRPTSRIIANGCAAMLDWLLYAILILGFPFGVLVGYLWRARISRARRARYLAERKRPS